ncbi:hypothetical protein GCK72_021582 [Caenorhabditis remanei]|uniref:C-type LECtin n=1 Tax=Caenorhabditis remanei TaxID=31234 RepID=A0A6A5GKE8_CAERE|nr:hypothetical protein GCK72_021582 [Caenorhabditis remanei]KAF1755015.1 hypothetical protein GCK72_021582 [Caenorhabditis remanei]
MKFIIYLFLFIAACNAASNNTICTNGFSLINNKCWKLFQEPANHTMAEKTCTGYGGTLFMAKTAIDNRAVGNYVSSFGIDHIWMGVFCIGNSKSQCYFDNQVGSTAIYDNFAPGFPNSGTGRCVYYAVPGSPSGQWINGDCMEQLPYVCELPTTHSDICDYNFNDHCYFRFNELPFSTAQLQCQQLCGNLVSIHSAEENRYITSIYSQFSYDFIRIGGIATSNDFVVWADGSVMDYSNLETFSTGGNCLKMSLKTTYSHSRGAWYTDDCSTLAHFVCKRPIGVPDCSGTPPPATVAPPPITPATCTTGVHVAPGVISSPNYPNAFRSGCAYTLTTYGSNKIRLTFNYVYTYSNADPIDIYDGDSTDAPLINTLYATCGSSCTDYFTSTGNTMYVNFRYSSNSQNNIGFNATFYSVF